MSSQRWSWPWSRLAVQITLVIFLVVAVSGFVSYTRVSTTVGERSEARFGEIVRRGAAQVHDQLEQSARLALADVSLLGSGAAFVDRAASGDALAAVRLAIPERTIGDAGGPSDLGLTIYDASGKLLLRAHQPSDQRVVPLPENVRRALGGDPTVTIREDATFGLSFAGAAPIQAPDGRIAGAIETLTRIDRPFVDHLATLSGVEVAIVTTSGPTLSRELARAVLVPTSPQIPLRVRDRPTS